MDEHDGNGTRRDRAKRALASMRQGGAGTWRPFTGEWGERARGVTAGVRQALDRVPDLARRKPANLLLVASAGGLLLVAAATFLLRRIGESSPTSGDIGRIAPTGAGRGGGSPQRAGGGGTAGFRRAGPAPGPGGLGRAVGPSTGPGRPGPGGLGRRQETGTEGFTGRSVPGRSATTASKAYEVPPGRTTATPASPVDEPVIPAGREAGYPTRPLRRKPNPGR